MRSCFKRQHKAHRVAPWKDTTRRLLTDTQKRYLRTRTRRRVHQLWSTRSTHNAITDEGRGIWMKSGHSKVLSIVFWQHSGDEAGNGIVTTALTHPTALLHSPTTSLSARTCEDGGQVTRRRVQLRDQVSSGEWLKEGCDRANGEGQSLLLHTVRRRAVCIPPIRSEGLICLCASLFIALRVERDELLVGVYDQVLWFNSLFEEPRTTVDEGLFLRWSLISAINHQANTKLSRKCKLPPIVTIDPSINEHGERGGGGERIPIVRVNYEVMPESTKITHKQCCPK
ncbi:hypothetical protein BLNAU_9948 [Blattamonas nauphoetae]|uniref:Uncharacterized protein n=1 Tax=Blattamonas nauphoetae TaxID=2049346 RepID=A0ABQ9XU62_9EUKA|nr:hypothetical protein BLNAU_9948 [Blattamonas nauphoetae]